MFSVPVVQVFAADTLAVRMMYSLYYKIESGAWYLLFVSRLNAKRITAIRVTSVRHDDIFKSTLYSFVIDYILLLNDVFTRADDTRVLGYPNTCSLS